MAKINLYLQSYALFVMIIIMLGNLHGNRKPDRAVRLFYGMLCSDIVMLFTGAVDYYLLSAGGRYASIEFVFEGLSDLSYFIILALFILFLDLYEKGENKRPGWMAVTGALVSVVYGVFWFIADAYDLIYDQSVESVTFGPLYVIGQIGGYVTAGLSIVILLRRWKSFNYVERFGFTFFILGPFAASLLKGVAKDITPMPIMVTISVLTIQSYVHAARERTIQQKETELARMQNELLISRMKPHFVYNVLNAIYGLCDISAERTKEAIAMFAQYLRNNLIDMDSLRLISFREEIANVENYLAIEKLRFGDLLTVEYDISKDDFMIPPLTVQTIVENAVHGIEKKPEGGMVKISSAERNNEYIITISDTGTGFDPEKVSLFSFETDNSGKKHLGLYSTRYLLRELCGGEISVESRPGGGAVAVIKIPEEEAEV
ncbi:MAG: histidine kinase [Lachnospiraceae bacterium]|nr:histidine kinase [Lachnospiraceae bacterium]